MEDQFTRTRMLFGENAMNRLRNAHVAVFGVGGVGGYVVEVLARSGVGELHLVDNDTVSLSNLNRQIIALHSTLGRSKVEVAEERIHDINPHCKVVKYPFFYLPENADMIDLTQMDYVVDCIDTVTAKVELISRCHKMGIPLLSCMGAANKTDATAFRVSDIYKTTMDPLAKFLRKRLRALGIPSLKVVYSEEPPLHPVEKAVPDNNQADASAQTHRRDTPSSNAFVPAAAGLAAGGEVIKDLIATAEDHQEPT